MIAQPHRTGQPRPSWHDDAATTASRRRRIKRRLNRGGLWLGRFNGFGLRTKLANVENAEARLRRFSHHHPLAALAEDPLAGRRAVGCGSGCH